MQLDKIRIRLEEPLDYRAVEELTRDAFWDKYRPGCTEHYILHIFRDHPDFIKELSYVLEANDRILAHIMYSKSIIETEDGRHPVITFGPISVLPEVQRQGLGSQLIRYTLGRAGELGYSSVAITGDPDYYSRFGFVSGDSLGIRYGGAPEGDPALYFMVRELKADDRSGVKGTFRESECYFIDDEEAEAFDRTFTPREKRKGA